MGKNGESSETGKEGTGTGKEKTTLQSLQSKHDVLKQSIQAVADQFASHPRPSFFGRSEVRGFVGLDPSKVAQSRQENQRAIENFQLAFKALDESKGQLPENKLEELTGVVNLLNDKYGKGFKRKTSKDAGDEDPDERTQEEIRSELRITHLIANYAEQLAKHLKGEGGPPVLENTLRELLDQKKKTERSIEQSILERSSIYASCTTAARVIDSQGRYLLLVHERTKREKGKILLSLIGGAMEMTDTGKEHIRSNFAVEGEQFGKGADMRFVIKGSEANNFREWFLTGKDRETNPHREFNEELVGDEKLLTAEDIQGLETKRAGYQSEVGPSTRKSRAGMFALHLLEIHDVTGPPALIKKLEKIVDERPDGPLRFVTTQEIENGQMEDGTKIAPLIKKLLDPRETIEELA